MNLSNGKKKHRSAEKYTEDKVRVIETFTTFEGINGGYLHAPITLDTHIPLHIKTPRIPYRLGKLKPIQPKDTTSPSERVLTSIPETSDSDTDAPLHKTTPSKLDVPYRRWLEHRKSSSKGTSGDRRRSSADMGSRDIASMQHRLHTIQHPEARRASRTLTFEPEDRSPRSQSKNVSFSDRRDSLTRCYGHTDDTLDMLFCPRTPTAGGQSRRRSSLTVTSIRSNRIISQPGLVSPGSSPTLSRPRLSARLLFVFSQFKASYSHRYYNTKMTSHRALAAIKQRTTRKKIMGLLRTAIEADTGRYCRYRARTRSWFLLYNNIPICPLLRFKKRNTSRPHTRVREDRLEYMIDRQIDNTPLASSLLFSRSPLLPSSPSRRSTLTSPPAFKPSTFRRSPLTTPPLYKGTSLASSSSLLQRYTILPDMNEVFQMKQKPRAQFSFAERAARLRELQAERMDNLRTLYSSRSDVRRYVKEWRIDSMRRLKNADVQISGIEREFAEQMITKKGGKLTLPIPSRTIGVQTTQSLHQPNIRSFSRAWKGFFHNKISPYRPEEHIYITWVKFPRRKLPYVYKDDKYDI